MGAGLKGRLDLDSLERINNWIEKVLPPGTYAVGCMVVLERMHDEQGRIDRSKMRIVAKGHV